MKKQGWHKDAEKNGVNAQNKQKHKNNIRKST